MLQTLAAEQISRAFPRLRRRRGVIIGSDGLAEGVIDGCAADHDFDLSGKGALGHALHDILDVDHRGGEQGGTGDDVGVVLGGGFNVFGRGHAVAEVDDVEALGFHHHADKVLADVVEVVLDGADDDGALFFHLVAHEEGTQTSVPAAIARAAMSTSGMKMSFFLKRSPMMSMPGA